MVGHFVTCNRIIMISNLLRTVTVSSADPPPSTVMLKAEDRPTGTSSRCLSVRLTLEVSVTRHMKGQPRTVSPLNWNGNGMLELLFAAVTTIPPPPKGDPRSDVTVSEIHKDLLVHQELHSTNNDQSTKWAKVNIQYTICGREQLKKKSPVLTKC